MNAKITKTILFPLLALLCTPSLFAQDSAYCKPEESIFLNVGVVRPLQSSWINPVAGFVLRASAAYSIEIGYRRFLKNKPWYLEGAFSSREVSWAFETTEEMATAMNPEYPVGVAISGWQKFTGLQLGLGYRYQPVNWWYLQGSASFGFAGIGAYRGGPYLFAATRENLDSAKLKVSGGVSAFGPDGCLSLGAAAETGINLGKHHSIGLRASFIKYGLMSFAQWGNTAYSSRYFISNDSQHHDLSFWLSPRLFNAAFVYQYRF